MSRTHHIKLPVTAEQVREFAVGDLVVIDGEIVTAPGMTTHDRIVVDVADRTVELDDGRVVGA